VTRHAQEVADFDRGNSWGQRMGRLMLQYHHDGWKDHAPGHGIATADLESMVRAMGATRDSNFYRGFEAGFRAAVAPTLTKNGGYMPPGAYDDHTYPEEARFRPVGEEPEHVECEEHGDDDCKHPICQMEG